MKKGILWASTALLLVAFIAGAAILYSKLSKEHGADNLVQTPTHAPAQGNDQQDHTPLAAPDFTVTDYDGNPVKLSDFRGKPVVINFWATWCYYCKEEMPDFNTAFKKYPDVQFLMVNATDGVQETVAGAKSYVEQNGFEFPVFFDTESQAVTAYQVTGFPATYLIDKDGNLVAQATGMISLEVLERGIGMIRQSN